MIKKIVCIKDFDMIPGAKVEKGSIYAYGDIAYTKVGKLTNDVEFGNVGWGVSLIPKNSIETIFKDYFVDYDIIKRDNKINIILK